MVIRMLFAILVLCIITFYHAIHVRGGFQAYGLVTIYLPYIAVLFFCTWATKNHKLSIGRYVLCAIAGFVFPVIAWVAIALTERAGKDLDYALSMEILVGMGFLFAGWLHMPVSVAMIHLIASNIGKLKQTK